MSHHPGSSVDTKRQARVAFEWAAASFRDERSVIAREAAIEADRIRPTISPATSLNSSTTRSMRVGQLAEEARDLVIYRHCLASGEAK